MKNQYFVEISENKNSGLSQCITDARGMPLHVIPMLGNRTVDTGKNDTKGNN